MREQTWALVFIGGVVGVKLITQRLAVASGKAAAQGIARIFKNRVISTTLGGESCVNQGSGLHGNGPDELTGAVIEFLLPHFNFTEAEITTDHNNNNQK